MISCLLAQMTDPDWGNLADGGPAIRFAAWPAVWFWLSAWPSWLYWGLLIWMVLYCVRNDPERGMWIWIMLLLQPFGAIVYFFVRYLPSSGYQAPAFLRRWRRLRDLPRLETAARQIGNPHQYVLLGDALREMGSSRRALEAYLQALRKEPRNLAALWGAASVEFLLQDFSAARDKLSQVLEQDFTYKFGDVSLLYAKTLLALGDPAAARDHLDRHIRKWRQPEAVYLLARLCADQNDSAAARRHLQGLIDDLDSSPRAIARKSLFWKSRAKRLLRRLPG